MKKIYAFILSGAAILAVTACNKEMQVEDPAQNNGPVYETLSVKIGTETKVTLDTDAAKSAFEENDQIAVYTPAGFQTCLVDGEGKITVDISSGARSNYAVYYNGSTAPTITDGLTISLPASYTYAQVLGNKNPVPMVAKNVSGESGDMTFYAVCGLLRLTISGIPTGTYSLKLDFNGKKVQGAFSIDSPVTPGASTIASDDCTKGTYDIIWITSESEISGPVTVNIPLPTGTYADLVVSAWDNSATPVALKAAVEHFTYEAANAKGKKFTSTLNKEIFTVGSGKYAVFSPGNLVATITSINLEGDPTAATWTFANYQYILERSVDEGGNQTFGTGDKVDTFAWVGASSTFYDGPVTKYGVNRTHHASNVKLEDGTYPCGNGYTEKLKSDWGQNIISGYAPGVWRPIVGGYGGEFEWMLGPKDDPKPGTNCRTGSRFEKAKVAGLNGILIFPDNYVHPTGVAELVDINVANRAFSAAQQFSADDFSQMEAAGVIFLGAAGFRQGPTFYDVEGDSIYIYYWAGNHSAQFWLAKQFNFGPSNIYPHNDSYRHNGFPVRLICPLN